MAISPSLSTPFWHSNATRAQAFLDHYPVTKFGGRSGHGIRCLAPELPGLMARFEWYLPNRPSSRYGAVERRHARDPRTVWAWPTELPRLLQVAKQDFDPSHQNRVVVFAGEDLHMSVAFGDGNTTRTAGVISQLRKYFGRILYASLDIPDPFVRVLPIGLTEHYTRHSVPDAAVDAIVSASISGDAKPKMALAAWGTYHDMEAAWRYKDKMPNSIYLAFESRVRARRWGQTAQARRAGVDVRSVEDSIHPRDWFRELSRYRFLISPLGDGIQSSKTIEALMVLTIPIVQRGPFPVNDRLRRMGFPIVVVSNWEEITLERLHEWWTLLSPRLAQFRHNCVSTDAYWRIIMGLTEYCD